MSRLLLACALFALACSSSDDNTGSGGSSGATADAGLDADGSPDVAADTSSNPDVAADTSGNPDVAADTSPDVMADTGNPDVVTDAAGEGAADAPADVANDVGPVSSCDEINTVECFANNECETERRCENAGTDADPVPCCVVGARGIGQAGDACVNENDCESGVCIAGTGDFMCSATCATNDDCPDGMKNCTFIAFSTSNDKWCLPTD